MKTGTGITLGLLLFLVPSHGPDGGWVSACRAAESTFAPLGNTFSGRGAEQILPSEMSLERHAPLAAMAQERIPSEEAGEHERGIHALEVASPLPVSGFHDDAVGRALTPATSFGLAHNPPVFQFPMPPISHGPASLDPQR